MEDSPQIILKVTTENLKIVPYFHKFADFMNYMYSKYDNFSVIELIDGGFVWIFRNFQYMKYAIDTFRNIRIETPEDILNQFFQEFTKTLNDDYKIDANEEIPFLLELINNYSDDVISLMEEYVSFLSKGIHLIKIDPQNYLWQFDTPYDFAIFFGMIHFLIQKNYDSS
jgi:hypothetical protein